MTQIPLIQKYFFCLQMLRRTYKIRNGSLSNFVVVTNLALRNINFPDRELIFFFFFCGPSKRLFIIRTGISSKMHRSDVGIEINVVAYLQFLDQMDDTSLNRIFSRCVITDARNIILMNSVLINWKAH